jgi:VanZ family protein
MQKRIKVWLELSPLILSICLTIGIVFLSLVNLGKTFPVGFFNIDKLYHFVAYFVLAFSWCLSLQKNELNVKFMLWIGIAVILFGIILEVLQKYLTDYRTLDYGDALANSAGVLVAVLFFSSFFEKIQRLRRKDL